MLTISSPAGKAGADPDAIRKMAGQAMLAGTILKIPMDTIGRELGMAIGGTITHRMPLLQRMPGLPSGEALRAMSPEQRLKTLQKAMDGLTAGASAKFATSWQAVWTTAKDMVLYRILTPLTTPLFNAVKGSLMHVGEWFDSNRGSVEAWVNHFARRLVEAWEFGTTKIAEWWPAIKSFADNAWFALERIWVNLEPVIERIGGKVKDALADPATIDKIGDVLKLYAATKVGMPLLSGVGGAAKLAPGVVEGVMGGAGVVEFGVAAAVAIPVLLAAAGAVHDLTDETSKYHDFATQQKDDIIGNLEATKAAADNLASPLGGLTGALDAFGAAALAWANAVIEYTPNILSLTQGISALFTDAELAKAKATMGPTEWYDKDTGLWWSTPKVGRGEDIGTLGGHGGVALGQAARAVAEPSVKKGAGPGGGGTHIQKVEIVVNTNQDVNRVAEAVRVQLTNINRHPKVSQLNPNYSTK
jgi:hypothetical protein